MKSLLDCMAMNIIIKGVIVILVVLTGSSVTLDIYIGSGFTFRYIYLSDITF